MTAVSLCSVELVKSGGVEVVDLSSIGNYRIKRTKCQKASKVSKASKSIYSVQKRPKVSNIHKLGLTPLDHQKISKVKHYMRSRHQNFTNPSENGKSYPNKSFQKITGTPTPRQDIERGAQCVFPLPPWSLDMLK